MNTNDETPGASAGAQQDTTAIRHHRLKIDERWFYRIADGSKTADVRKHDRDYQIGDMVTFVAAIHDNDSWQPTRIGVIGAVISHVLPASVFPDGLQPGYSVLSLTSVSSPVYDAVTEDRR